MMKLLLYGALLFCVSFARGGDSPRRVIDLNGTWEFDQTVDAFPPSRFTRTIPVPGLIHLARPRIEQYTTFFQRPDTVANVSQYDLRDRDYRPMYSWYHRRILIPEEYRGTESVLTILKSQYGTQVYVNGLDVGSSMACYTPIDLVITSALKCGEENEILIRVGDRAWLPSEAAGGTDKEKMHYLPGIWDNVFLSFTGKLHIQRTLLLPSVATHTLTAKVRIRSLFPPQLLYGTPMFDSCRMRIDITEKVTGRHVQTSWLSALVKRDNITDLELEVPLPLAHLWSPDDPFLYRATVTVYHAGGLSDSVSSTFGMRDFTRKGRFFSLNGTQILLRGSNITLQRFFEDPDCGDLAWDSDWVRTLLGQYPKHLNWNAMRICVGIAPSLWYDIADSCGLLLQNEWLYWQNHGWDDQIRKEYTDWVWADGSHPSIAIWDAINENWDPYIGNVLIPELKKLDPTRVWDAGYMTGSDMAMDEMDEPHPYRAGWQLMTVPDISAYLAEHPFLLGKLEGDSPELSAALQSSSPQLVNEYGWIWLWRDGRPSKLTVRHYGYFLGEGATAEQRRELQAYWLQLETEWLRSQRSLAGVLAFCYLTNNYGFTGDWFIGNVSELNPGPTLFWFRHAFAPVAVFLDMTDERYLRGSLPHPPGSQLALTLVCVNDRADSAEGVVRWTLIDADGKRTPPQSIPVTGIPPFGKNVLRVDLRLPEASGGYLLVAEFTQRGEPETEKTISRRYLKVGDTATPYRFYDMVMKSW